jgi:hypothetical protein
MHAIFPSHTSRDDIAVSFTIDMNCAAAVYCFPAPTQSVPPAHTAMNVRAQR